MRIRSKLAMVEKRMHVTNLGRHCPLCCTRPAEIVYVEAGQAVPPSQALPCPLCGKGPQRYVIQLV